MRDGWRVRAAISAGLKPRPFGGVQPWWEVWAKVPRFQQILRAPKLGEKSGLDIRSRATLARACTEGRGHSRQSTPMATSVHGQGKGQIVGELVGRGG